MWNPDDPVMGRKTGRVISLAMCLSVTAFALIVWQILGAGDGSGRELWDRNTTLVVAVTAIMLAQAVGARMHVIRGTLGERVRRVRRLQIASMAVCEAAAFFALISLLIARDWRASLPVGIAGVGLLVCAVRADFCYGRLIAEAAGTVS